MYTPPVENGAVLVVKSTYIAPTTPRGWRGEVVNLGTAPTEQPSPWIVYVICADIAED